MLLQLRRMRQMDPSQPTNSPTTLLILHLRWKRRSKKSSLHLKNWMRRRKSMATKDSTASKLPLKTTAFAINRSFLMRQTTLTLALRQQKSLFAHSPGQNHSLERKPKEKTSTHGLNLHSKLSEEFYFETSTSMSNRHLSITC